MPYADLKRPYFGAPHNQQRLRKGGRTVLSKEIFGTDNAQNIFILCTKSVGCE